MKPIEPLSPSTEATLKAALANPPKCKSGGPADVERTLALCLVLEPMIAQLLSDVGLSVEDCEACDGSKLAAVVLAATRLAARQNLADSVRWHTGMATVALMEIGAADEHKRRADVERIVEQLRKGGA